MRPDEGSRRRCQRQARRHTRPRPNPGGKPTPQAATAQQISLSLGEGPTALTALPGTCAPAGTKALLSTDNGANWKTLEGPAAVVPRVNVTGAGAGFAIGAHGMCGPPTLPRHRRIGCLRGAGVPAADPGSCFRLPRPDQRTRRNKASPAEVSQPSGSRPSGPPADPVR